MLKKLYPVKEIRTAKKRAVFSEISFTERHAGCVMKTKKEREKNVKVKCENEIAEQGNTDFISATGHYLKLNSTAENNYWHSNK